MTPSQAGPELQGARVGSAPLLRMQGIRKTFGPVVALDGVDFTVEPRQVHGLLGGNGAGKTTLMNVLYGLYEPDDGRIEIEGRAVSVSSPRDAIAAGVGMVHQTFLQVGSVHRRGERGAGTDTRGTRPKERIAELSERFGLAVDPNARVETLPVGVRQRVEILKALYRGAKVLVLDEPTTNLTPQEVDDLFSSMRAIVDEGMSVVLITHKIRETMAVCDVMTVMRDGRWVATVDKADTRPTRSPRHGGWLRGGRGRGRRRCGPGRPRGGAARRGGTRCPAVRAGRPGRPGAGLRPDRAVPGRPSARGRCRARTAAGGDPRRGRGGRQRPGRAGRGAHRGAQRQRLAHPGRRRARRASDRGVAGRGRRLRAGGPAARRHPARRRHHREPRARIPSLASPVRPHRLASCPRAGRPGDRRVQRPDSQCRNRVRTAVRREHPARHLRAGVRPRAEAVAAAQPHPGARPGVDQVRLRADPSCGGTRVRRHRRLRGPGRGHRPGRPGEASCTRAALSATSPGARPIRTRWDA